MQIFSTFTLKIIAVSLMLMDHLYLVAALNLEIPIWFSYLGRIVAPIFFYLIVESFFHTRSRANYLARLTGFGVLMIGVDKWLGIDNNIFFALALAVALMSLFEFRKESSDLSQKTLAIFGIGITGFMFLFVEGSIYALIMTLIFYLLRDKRKLMALTYGLFSLIPAYFAIGSEDIYRQLFLVDYQWMMIFAAPLILMHDGKLGFYNSFTKWMFYAFYPAHLVALVLLTRYL